MPAEQPRICVDGLQHCQMPRLCPLSIGSGVGEQHRRALLRVPDVGAVLLELENVRRDILSVVLDEALSKRISRTMSGVCQAGDRERPRDVR